MLLGSESIDVMSLRVWYYVYETGVIGGKQTNFLENKNPQPQQAGDEKNSSEEIFFLYRQELARILDHIRSFCR